MPMSLSRRLREMRLVSKRQDRWDALFARMLEIDVGQPPEACVALAQGLGRLFTDYGDPSRWDGHFWRRTDARDATCELYRTWIAGEWAHVGVAVPPSSMQTIKDLGLTRPMNLN